MLSATCATTSAMTPSSNPAARTASKSRSVTLPRTSTSLRAKRTRASVLESTAVPSRLSRIWSAVSPIVLAMAEWAATQQSLALAWPTASPAAPASWRTAGSVLHFQDDFQFDRRTEWQARNTKDKARRDGLVAEDISKQLRRGIGDLRVLRELRRRGDVHPQPHDVAHAVERT